MIGLTVLFAFILCAVPLYIYCGFKNQPYEFLDKNIPFELEYGVKGLVTEKKNAFRPTYIAYNIIATCVYILSVVPLVLLSFSENEILVAVALALLMITAGIGTGMFIVVGTQNASMQKLLKEGDFTEKEKNRTGVKEVVGFCYVHAPDNSSGHRVQEVEISYNYIGILPATLLYDLQNEKTA